MIRKMVLFAMALMFFLSACSPVGGVQPAESPQACYEQMQATDQERICFDFLMGSMITKQGGVRTNYLEKGGDPELATGAEVLSESMGLLMLYAVGIRDEALFESLLHFVQSHLDTGNILSYRYSPETGAYRVNAFVDDMRIIRALLKAAEVFGGSYMQTALQYANRLYDTNVKDHRIYDLYDDVYHTTNDFVTLCYSDLDTMRLLADQDPRWDEVFKTMKGILHKGYISDAFPLYRGSFSYTAMEYSQQDILMVQSLLTVLSLAQTGECPQRTLDYLKDCVQNKAIYGAYHPDGVPVGDTESTAVYAICAMIADAVYDDEMYALCIGRMNRFQATDEASEVYGAFADMKTLDLYAFDNLTALLAYRRGW